MLCLYENDDDAGIGELSPIILKISFNTLHTSSEDATASRSSGDTTLTDGGLAATDPVDTIEGRLCTAGDIDAFKILSRASFTTE